MSTVTVTETTNTESETPAAASPIDTKPAPPPAAAAEASSTSTATNSTHNNSNTNTNNKFDFGSYSYSPEDKVQYIVQTPYGRGLTIRTWKNSDSDQTIRMREIELLDWTTASTATSSTSSTVITRGPVRPATLFSPLNFPSVEPKVDDDVVCLYGRGRVQQVRHRIDDDAQKVVVVRLSSWRLAGRSTVTCSLNANSVQVVRKKKMYEMNTHERVELAQQLKTTAGLLFTQKDYAAALQSYSHAIDALRYISEANSRAVPPEIRADLVILIITCNNNAATCTWHLASQKNESTTTTQQQQQQQSLFYAEKTLKYARDALVVLDALEKNKGQKIHQQLVQKDAMYSDIKLFGEMKVKSYILQARALMHQYETVKALECLNSAHDIIAHYTSSSSSSSLSSSGNDSNNILQTSIKNLHSSSKDIKKLHQLCRQRRIKEKQKEKLRAQAMFGGGSSASVDEEKKEITISQPSSPTNNEIQQQQHVQLENLESLIINSKDNDDVNDNTVKQKVKRRVSFSEKVIYKEEIEGSKAEYEELPSHPPAVSPYKKNKSSTMANKSINKLNNWDNNSAETDDLEWHEDPEVVTGLCIFAGTVALTALGTWYLVSGSKRT